MKVSLLIVMLISEDLLLMIMCKRIHGVRVMGAAIDVASDLVLRVCQVVNEVIHTMLALICDTVLHAHVTNFFLRQLVSIRRLLRLLRLLVMLQLEVIILALDVRVLSLSMLKLRFMLFLLHHRMGRLLLEVNNLRHNFNDSFLRGMALEAMVFTSFDYLVFFKLFRMRLPAVILSSLMNFFGMVRFLSMMRMFDVVRLLMLCMDRFVMRARGYGRLSDRAANILGSFGLFLSLRRRLLRLQLERLFRLLVRMVGHTALLERMLRVSRYVRRRSSMPLDGCLLDRCRSRLWRRGRNHWDRRRFWRGRSWLSSLLRLLFAIT